MATVTLPDLPRVGDDELRAEVLDELVLDGRQLDADVADRTIDLVLERTIEGASTLTLTLWDPDCELVDSDVFAYAVDLEIADEAFRLTQLSNQSWPLLSLTFEDRNVAYLRAHNAPWKISRAKATRAEAALMLVQQVKAAHIRFFSPDLHKRQPIAKARQIAKRPTRDRRRDHGFANAADVKVKGAKAEKAQLRVIDEALTTGQSMKASRRVLVGAVMCITQESAARNLRGGGRDSVGAFQQRRSMGWPASRDVAKDAAEFFKRAIPIFKANPGRSIGWCVDQVQRSHTFGTDRQGADYDQWRGEAGDTVDTWLGGASATGGGAGAGGTYTKRYEFRRGEPGKPEDSWTAIRRWADEVHWRCFMDRGVVYYISDDALMASRTRLVIDRQALPAGIDSHPRFDVPIGPDDEVTVTARAGFWTVPMGAVIELKRYGRASGRYLTASYRHSLFEVNATITLRRRREPLPEPAAETAQRSSGGGSSAPEGFDGAHVGKAYAAAKRIHERHLPYVWGGGHNGPGNFNPSGGGYDCSGSVSAVLHSGGMLDSDQAQTSGWFETWGEAGEGKYLTVYANSTHVFIVFNMTGSKEHWGTGDWGKGWGGAGFNPHMHPTAGFRARHWAGEQERKGSTGVRKRTARAPRRSPTNRSEPA